MEAYSYCVNSGLFKYWSLGLWWGHNGGHIFTLEYIEKFFNNLLLKNHLARKDVTYMEAFPDSVDSIFQIMRIEKNLLTNTITTERAFYLQ